MTDARSISIQFGVAVAILCSVGCPPKVTRIPQPVGSIPTAMDFVVAQQRRVQAVPSLSLRGHAELQWRDEKGRHFDDGDFDLVVRPPSDLSLRVGKLGEKFLWVGAGGGHSWIVLPRESPSRAVIRDWNESESSHEMSMGIGVTGLDGVIEPRRLIEALGLANVTEGDISAIGWDEIRGAWCFTLLNRRAYARGETLLPIGCEWLNLEMRVVGSCTLDNFEWIRGTWPIGSPPSSVQALVPTRIRFALWSQGRRELDEEPGGEIKLSAQEPSFGGDRIRPQLFNWDDVKAALRPEVIEESQE